MDNFIVRWYNQNKKIIWTVVLTFIAVIGLIQSLNNYYKKNPKTKSSSTINSTTTYNTPNYSVVTQEKINETTSEESIYVIDRFINYCNNWKIESAYNLLSKACKEELYPTIEDFETKYINKYFAEKKSCDYKLWITTNSKHTYRIQIREDLLATGTIDNMPIEDYYTILYEGGEYKLNISGFIGKQDINVSKTQNNITVNIIAKINFINYEIYEINVQNGTGNKIIFNTKENIDSMYIKDENELQYIAFLNEIPNSEFEILTGCTKKLKIKFNREYKPTINIEKIVFEDINSNGKIQNIEIEL